MMRRIVGILLLVLPPFAAAEQGGPEAIEIPDIRANIIKMLQEKGERPDNSGIITPEAKPQAQPDPEDLFEQAREQMEQKSGENKAPVAPTVTAPQPPEEPVKPSVDEESNSNQPYVPLPSKQITIEDLDDLEELQWEIDEAKKRQRQQ